MYALSAQVPAFCTLLRAEYGFAAGQAEAHDCLRALDVLGIVERGRVRTAMRLVCCSSPADVAAFDEAFDRFFTPEPAGIAQPAYAPRHTRPGSDDAPPASERDTPRPAATAPPENDERDGGRATERRPTGDASDDEQPRSAAARARYSPLAVVAESPPVDRADESAMAAAAARLIAAVRLGRSRRLRPMPRGGRFDMRGTVRASLQTGGEPFEVRYHGHPPRNPRFVVLVDGSRSVADRTHAIVAFARALVARSLRANAFFFSTELRDVTRALRAAPPDSGLAELGGAWGGGTKIGASLAAFSDRHGARVLGADTVVIIFSDGLDVGDVGLLARAMRDIDRRCAGIVWLNPHASVPGFAPTARGMRAALPYVTLLASADDARGFERLADRIGRHPRIRGRRR